MVDDSLLPATKATVGKPLKAPNDVLAFDDPRIPYSRGVAGSYKIDGNRGICINGVARTSSGKVVPNRRVHQRFEEAFGYFKSLDVIVDYEIFAPSLKHHAQLSGILNSYDNPLPEDLALYVFDAAPRSMYLDQCVAAPFGVRIGWYEHLVAHLNRKDIIALKQYQLENATAAREFFEEALNLGYEGAMLRATHTWEEGSRLRGGYYKHGRATVNEGCIFKFKETVTVDGRILDILPRRELKPDYPRRYNTFGAMIGSYPQEAYTELAEAGAFRVEYYDSTAGKLKVCLIGWGKGFPRQDRVAIWNNRQELLGKWLEFKMMEHGADAEGGARHGRIVRFRPDKDV